MNNPRLISRCNFNLQAAFGVLSGTTITIGGCGSNSPTDPTPTPSAGSDELGVISTNHGHEAVITSAKLMSEGVLLLDIQDS